MIGPDAQEVINIIEINMIVILKNLLMTFSKKPDVDIDVNCGKKTGSVSSRRVLVLVLDPDTFDL